MQIFPSERPMPAPLICSGCRHWGALATPGRSEIEQTGRCGRFAETRPAASRPRCNICWEPAVIALPIPDGPLADD